MGEPKQFSYGIAIAVRDTMVMPDGKRWRLAKQDQNLIWIEVKNGHAMGRANKRQGKRTHIIPKAEGGMENAAT